MTDKEHPRDFPVYLAYSIAVPTPEDFGDVQTELCIKPTGSFSVQGGLKGGQAGWLVLHPEG